PLLVNVCTSYRRPTIPLTVERCDDGLDLPPGHPIHRFRGRPRCQCALVRVELGVGAQVQVRVVQLAIEGLHRQATAAAVLNDSQYRFGSSHLAFLTIPAYRVTCPTSPCERLSRPPWWGVTPTTTIGTP